MSYIINLHYFQAVHVNVLQVKYTHNLFKINSLDSFHYVVIFIMHLNLDDIYFQKAVAIPCFRSETKRLKLCLPPLKKRRQLNLCVCQVHMETLRGLDVLSAS